MIWHSNNSNILFWSFIFKFHHPAPSVYFHTIQSETITDTGNMILKPCNIAIRNMIMTFNCQSTNRHFLMILIQTIQHCHKVYNHEVSSTSTKQKFFSWDILKWISDFNILPNLSSFRTHFIKNPEKEVSRCFINFRATQNSRDLWPVL